MKEGLSVSFETRTRTKEIFVEILRLLSLSIFQYQLRCCVNFIRGLDLGVQSPKAWNVRTANDREWLCCVTFHFISAASKVRNDLIHFVFHLNKLLMLCSACLLVCLWKMWEGFVPACCIAGNVAPFTSDFVFAHSIGIKSPLSLSRNLFLA